MSWAFRQPLAGNEKVVLLALADRANDSGVCWPGQAEVAAKAYISTKTVGRVMARLEEAGYLRREPRFKDGQRTSDLTILNLVRPTDNLSADKNGGDQQTPVSERNRQEEPSEGESARPDARLPVPVPKLPKIGGKPVVAVSWDMTARILESFNAQAGKKLRLVTSAGEPSEAAKRIYGRVRVYPDLTLEEHADIIKRTLASRWWGDGPAGIGVIYGPKVFEDNITRQPSQNGGGAARGGRQSASDLLRKLQDNDNGSEEL